MRRLRAALRAYPLDVREADGEVLVGLAQDLVEDGASSANREALGLLAGGLSARAQRFAGGSWEDGLRLVAFPIAAAFLAIACGAVTASLPSPAWPGWRAVAVLGAPAVAVYGLLAGRRLPVVAGAAGLVLLGIAQSNSHLQTPDLAGTVLWGRNASHHGFEVPLLGVAIPGALVLAGAAAVVEPRCAARSTVLAALAWIAGGAVAVRLAITRAGDVTVGDLGVDGVGLCMAAYGAGVAGALLLAVVRRRRRPAAVIAALTVLPGVSLYGAAVLPYGDAPALAAAALAATAAAAVLLVRPAVRAG